MTQKARELALLTARTLSDKKAKDICIMDISEKTIIADCFVVASGSNTIQVKTLCDEVERSLEENGIHVRRVEGYEAGRWIVMDYTDILVHIFLDEERSFYNIERLWNTGSNIEVFYE